MELLSLVTDAGSTGVLFYAIYLLAKQNEKLLALLDKISSICCEGLKDEAAAHTNRTTMSDTQDT